MTGVSAYDSQSNRLLTVVYEALAMLDLVLVFAIILALAFTGPLR